jgi:hypothetical protein
MITLSSAVIAGLNFSTQAFTIPHTISIGFISGEENSEAIQLRLGTAPLRILMFVVLDAPSYMKCHLN